LLIIAVEELGCAGIALETVILAAFPDYYLNVLIIVRDCDSDNNTRFRNLGLVIDTLSEDVQLASDRAVIAGPAHMETSLICLASE